MQNIVVDTEQSLVKIIDFGLSNYWSMEEPLSTHCGSPEYAAPELFVSGRKYGPEVDLWSLGVVMFCMSAGSLPFCLSERELSLSHDHQRRLLVTRIRKGIVEKHKNCLSHYSKEFRNLISGLLMPKPYQRFRVEQVLCHPWTTKSPSLLLDIPKTVTPNNNISGMVLIKMCAIMNAMPKELEKRIRREPLGPAGGIHRILYHNELRRHWRLFEIFSPLHTLSGSLSSGSLLLRNRSRMISRPNAAKAKSAETCKAETYEVDGMDSSFDYLKSEEEEYFFESYQESDSTFRQEPWSTNLSTDLMNNQTTLIVASIRNKNNLYNWRKTEFNRSDEIERLQIGKVGEMEGPSETSTAKSTGTNSRKETHSVERRAVSAGSKNSESNPKEQDGRKRKV